MKETVVEVKDVSIKFNMSSEKYDSFKEYIIKMIKQQITYHSFWALKNVICHPKNMTVSKNIL